MDSYTAERIAEGINCWSWVKYHRQIITADEILKLNPVATNKSDGYLVYLYQWEGNSVLAFVCADGRIIVGTPAGKIVNF